MSEESTAGNAPASDDVRDMTYAEADDRSKLWRRVLGLWALAVVATVLVYLPTAIDLVRVWWASATFNHGFVIPLISAYLAWERRHAVKTLTPAPWLPAIVAFFGVSVLWFLGWLADAALLQHAALVLAVILTVPAILGPKVAHALLFPLVFLLFAIPAGEELIPPFRDLTAWFVVRVLELLGIPVYWDGYFIEVPGGLFKVAEACAGVRYLIAGLALGAMFANIAFKSWIRRLNVMILAVLVPIVANIVRAAGIVLLAYYSDMQVAVGIDHLIYGWLFFVFIAFLLIGVGITFSDRDRDDPAVDLAAVQKGEFRPFANGNAIVAASVVVFLIVLGPTWAAILGPSPPIIAEVSISPPDVAGWHYTDESEDPWRPRFNNIDAEFTGTYTREGERVSLYMGYYQVQRPGAEVIQYGNTIAAPEPYDLSQSGKRRVEAGNRSIQVIRSRVIGGRQPKMIWHAYWVDDALLADRYDIKLRGMRSKLLGRPDAGIIAISVPFYPDASKSERILQDFLDGLMPIDRHFVRIRELFREARSS